MDDKLTKSHAYLLSGFELQLTSISLVPLKQIQCKQLNSEVTNLAEHCSVILKGTYCDYLNKLKVYGQCKTSS